MHIFRTFSLAVDRLNDGLGRLLQWLTLIMVLLGAYNALARYSTRYTGLSISSNGIYELQWYMFSAIFLLGAAYGLQHDSHVRVDVLYARLSKKGKAWIDLGGTILFLIPFCVLMLWVTAPAVRNSWSIREVSPDPGGLPRYPIKTLLLVSFVLLMLQGLSQAIKQVAILRGKTPPEALEPAAHEPDVRHGEGI